MHLIVTVEFADQLAATNKPVASLEAAEAIIRNEAAYPNTVRAYAWNRTNGNRIISYLLGPARGLPVCYQNGGQPSINIDTLVEDYRI